MAHVYTNKGGTKSITDGELFYEEDGNQDDGEENDEREVLIDEIITLINVIHPIIYDVYNLCEMHTKKTIQTFKVLMLKEICRHFELKFTSKDRKDDLINIISKMIENCTCCRK